MKFAVRLGASNAKRLIIGLATAQKKGVQGDEKAPAGSCDIPEMARRRSPTRWCVCTWKSMASRLASWRQRAVIQGDAPLLLSRSTMKSLRAVTDFELRRRPCRCKQMDLDA